MRSSARRPLLSIVIPMCNTGEWIGRCVGSMLDQNVETAMYEIVIVDDGSTDNGAEVAAAIVAKNSNITLIRQSNCGLGSARNRGLISALGEYVWFVDSDDYLLPGGLLSVIDALSTANFDILAIGAQTVDEFENRIKWVDLSWKSQSGVPVKAARFFRDNYRLTYAWLYVFRTNLLKSRALYFQPRINMQDAELLPRIFGSAESVIICPASVYAYVKRRSSYMNSSDHGVRDGYFLSVIEVHERLSRFLETVYPGSELAVGVTAKINAVRQIALLSWVYDPQSVWRMRARQEKLKISGMYPFRLSPNEGDVSRCKVVIAKSLANYLGWRGVMAYSYIRHAKNDALRIVRKFTGCNSSGDHRV